MKHLLHALEGAGLALLAQAPAFAASGAVRHFIENHPAWAAYVPLAVGAASALYRWAKARKPAPLPTPAVPPAAAPPA